MNRKFSIYLFLIVVLFLSLNAIYASDINMTCADRDSVSLQVEYEDSILELESGDFDNVSENQADAKNQTELISPSQNSYGFYNVILKDSSTNVSLANKTVTFVLDGVEYVGVTDSDGVAGVNLSANPGNYVVNVYFDGDYDCQVSNLTSQVKILSTVKAASLSKYYRGSAKYSATFFDIYGKTLSNHNVNISINGKSYVKKTNSKGVVSLQFNLKPGTYKVIATNPVTGYQVTNTVKIKSTLKSSNLKKVAGDGKKFTVKFFKTNGKPLTNKYVKFKIGSKTYNVKTNSKGYASLDLKKFKKGTYKVISYNSDGLSNTNTIKIYSIANSKLTTSFYTILPNESKVIKVKLTNTIGDVSGKTIKFTFNGKSYSKKTDSSGIASLNMAKFKKGFFKIEYKYAGNKFFKSAKSTNYVTLLNTVNPTLTVKSTKNFGYGAGTYLKVAFTSGGVPLVKRAMTFTIEDNEYTTTTDYNGIGSVPIDLNIGEYTVSYKTSNKYKVNGTSGSCSISVFQRYDCKLTWKSGTSFKDSLQTFKVLLTDTNGNPISGGNIVLTIDGETHAGKTSSKGYATIKTDVAIGKYKVSVKFTGNNNFLPASTSKSINVKLSKFGGGLNEKNSISYLSAYLKSTSHCPVNNAKIKALVKSLTSGLTDKVDKAKAIFNYVRDEVSYSYYYNSHKGALGTLSSKSANCVDQAHLLVAMYRAAGLKARYVHGTCTFSDGVFGHVWTQVLIDNAWVVGDPISYKNSLGKIKNWNPNTYKLHNRYLNLPF